VNIFDAKEQKIIPEQVACTPSLQVPTKTRTRYNVGRRPPVDRAKSKYSNCHATFRSIGQSKVNKTSTERQKACNIILVHGPYVHVPPTATAITVNHLLPLNTLLKVRDTPSARLKLLRVVSH
jgi:hypothetical protein